MISIPLISDPFNSDDPFKSDPFKSVSFAEDPFAGDPFQVSCPSLHFLYRFFFSLHSFLKFAFFFFSFLHNLFKLSWKKLEKVNYVVFQFRWPNGQMIIIVRFEFWSQGLK